MHSKKRKNVLRKIIQAKKKPTCIEERTKKQHPEDFLDNWEMQARTLKAPWKWRAKSKEYDACESYINTSTRNKSRNHENPQMTICSSMEKWKEQHLREPWKNHGTTNIHSKKKKNVLRKVIQAKKTNMHSKKRKNVPRKVIQAKKKQTFIEGRTKKQHLEDYLNSRETQAIAMTKPWNEEQNAKEMIHASHK